MAARLRTHHQDDVRRKIQAAKLINLLAEHVEGKRNLSPTQVQSARILLDKSVSNAPTDVNADLSGDVVVRWASGK